MSGGGVGQGAVYSPLPQSISDTDSSEEELNSTQHNEHRKYILSNKDCLEKHNGKKMAEYHPLGHDTEIEVSVNGLPNRDQTAADDVPIIKPDNALQGPMGPMSPLRKCCFIFSIFLCGFTIVAFLWLLPCDWAACSSAPLKLGTKSWETTLRGIELKGGINVVMGLPGRSRNLVFLARGDIISAALNSTPAKQTGHYFPAEGGGLVSLIGSTGKVAWFVNFLRIPLDMDCSLIDVNDDGAEDCIVVGTERLLAAVDSISGNIMWYLHNHYDNRSYVDLKFPLVVPDLDGDGVQELVTVCSFENASQHNNLIVISGKMGNMLGKAVTIPTCLVVHSLAMTGNWRISFQCENHRRKEFTKTISIEDLYGNATQKTVNLSMFSNITLRQHVAPMKILHKDSLERESSHATYSVNGRNLTVENKGHCPYHCTLTVKVIDTRPGHGNEKVWNFSADSTYGMIPAILVFNNHTGFVKRSTSIEPVTGFVLKYWQWDVAINHMNRANHVFGSVTDSTSSNPLFRNRLKRSRRLLQRMHNRAVLTMLQNATQMELHQLKERVVLITFNATDHHIVNASQSDVVQLCSHVGITNKSICQPDLKCQEQSCCNYPHLSSRRVTFPRCSATCRIFTMEGCSRSTIANSQHWRSYYRNGSAATEFKDLHIFQCPKAPQIQREWREVCKTHAQSKQFVCENHFLQ